MTAPWTRNLLQSDTAAGARTSIVPVNNNNGTAVQADELLMCYVCTQGTCTRVSDNVNGPWSLIASVTNGGVELSLWDYRRSKPVGINSLVVTATTTSAHGIGQVFSWQGGIGLYAFVATAIATATAISTSLQSGDTVGQGNLGMFMQANGSNDTSAGAPSGDVTTAVSGISNGTDCAMEAATMGDTNSGLTGTGLRSMGLTGLTGAVARCGIGVFFWLASPVPGSHACCTYRDCFDCDQAGTDITKTCKFAQARTPAWIG